MVACLERMVSLLVFKTTVRIIEHLVPGLPYALFWDLSISDLSLVSTETWLRALLPEHVVRMCVSLRTPQL